MIRLYTIELWGFEPAPWKVPDVGTTTNKAGRRFRFARRSGKSNLAVGRVCMEDWQAQVAQAAREKMNGRGPETGPVALTLTFVAETPPGYKHGQLWQIPVTWDKKRRRYKKSSRFGRGEPDLTNLQKSTEDALKGIVFVDDCQCRPITSVPLFGPVPGVRVEVFRVTDDDYPGQGDPVE